MGRPPKVFVEGGVYHVYNRVARGQPVFRHKVCGPFWQGRFKAKLVQDPRYVWQLIIYVHNNPAAAGVVEDLAEYEWSGHREVLRRSGQSLLDVDEMLLVFGEGRRAAKRAYLSALEAGREALRLDPTQPVAHDVVIGSLRGLGRMEEAVRWDVDLFAALAEFERELIAERTKAGLASARARGRRGGRTPKMTPAKLRLAREIVTAMHNADAARQAEAEFIRVFSQREIPSDMPTFALRQPMTIIDLLAEAGLARSKSEARRLADIVRAEDPTRPVTVGCNHAQAGFNGFQQAVDVFVGKTQLIFVGLPGPQIG